ATALHLHNIESSLVRQDIRSYLKEKLSSSAFTLAQIDDLARESGSLFLYATVLVRLIRDVDKALATDPRLDTKKLSGTSHFARLRKAISARISK
ncbi:hypothetical protein FRC11_012301, partial [Ceratobasidium sp. 423]